MSPDDLTAVLLVAFATTLPHGSTNPREYIVDTARSQLWVVTHRSGLLSFLGHEHAIVPAQWSAVLCLDDPLDRGAAATIVITTSSLEIDTDSARALAGLGKGPGEKDMGEMQRKLLDAEHLDAEHHPEIRLELQSLEPDSDHSVTAHVRLTLRGITRDYQLPVGVQRPDDSALELTGELQIHQRDFGIEPESVAGVVNVANEVDLRFRLVAAATTRPCTTRA